MKLPELVKLQIVSAAIRTKEGKIYSVPRPGRHHHVLRHMVEQGEVPPIMYEDQGFLLSDGRFIKRLTAAFIALRNGQCKKLYAPPSLFSEDLW